MQRDHGAVHEAARFEERLVGPGFDAHHLEHVVTLGVKFALRVPHAQ